jgi:hypothetical protein
VVFSCAFLLAMEERPLRTGAAGGPNAAPAEPGSTLSDGKRSTGNFV